MHHWTNNTLYNNKLKHKVISEVVRQEKIKTDNFEIKQGTI